MTSIDQPNVQKRSEFLTVLCVLTFVNAIYHIVSGAISIFAAGDSEEEIGEARQQMEEVMQTEEVPGFLESFLGGAMDGAVLAAENAVLLGTGEILLFAAIGIGALLMWQLKKVGFYIYTAANVVWLIFTPVVLDFHAFALYGAIAVFIFVALFVGMYAANLKQLK